MMTNPLLGQEGAWVGAHHDFRGMVPGETRTVMLATRKDERGRPIPESREPKTIHRTTRPFMADWVDSTNAELEARGSGLRWYFPDGYHMPPKIAHKRFAK